VNKEEVEGTHGGHHDDDATGGVPIVTSMPSSPPHIMFQLIALEVSVIGSFNSTVKIHTRLLV
jgi:hypothetical protein